MDMGLRRRDRDHLRATIEVARRARARGNRPFGALLVADDGRILGLAENSQVTDEQVLAHAEMNLLHRAVRSYPPGVLAAATLYTSAEPCAMCAGAVFWTGIGRLVYALGAPRLHALDGHTAEALHLPARDVLAAAGRRVEVVGPLLEDEAALLFDPGFDDGDSTAATAERWRRLTAASR